MILLLLSFCKTTRAFLHTGLPLGLLGNDSCGGGDGGDGGDDEDGDGGDGNGDGDG